MLFFFGKVAVDKLLMFHSNDTSFCSFAASSLSETCLGIQIQRTGIFLDSDKVKTFEYCIKKSFVNTDCRFNNSSKTGI